MGILRFIISLCSLARITCWIPTIPFSPLMRRYFVATVKFYNSAENKLSHVGSQIVGSFWFVNSSQSFSWRIWNKPPKLKIRHEEKGFVSVRCAFLRTVWSIFLGQRQTCSVPVSSTRTTVIPVVQEPNVAAKELQTFGTRLLNFDSPPLNSNIGLVGWEKCCKFVYLLPNKRHGNRKGGGILLKHPRSCLSLV